MHSPGGTASYRGAPAGTARRCIVPVLRQPRVEFLPPELASLLGTFIIFVTFGYPMRRLVIFRVPQRG